MKREVERAPVNRHEKFAAQQVVSVQGVVRAHVNVGPLLTVSAYFKHGEIERAEALANFTKAVFERAGICAEEDVVRRRFDCECRP